MRTHDVDHRNVTSSAWKTARKCGERSFDITYFFTLMYIKGPDHEKAFSEVFRVLVPGGLFLIWDVILPQCPDETKDIAAFPLLIKLPNEEISTGYGTLWPEEEQDLSYYLRLAGKAGFNIIEQREHNRVLFLKLQRP